MLCSQISLHGGLAEVLCDCCYSIHLHSTLSASPAPSGWTWTPTPPGACSLVEQLRHVLCLMASQTCELTALPCPFHIPPVLTSRALHLELLTQPAL